MEKTDLKQLKDEIEQTVRKRPPFVEEPELFVGTFETVDDETLVLFQPNVGLGQGGFQIVEKVSQKYGLGVNTGFFKKDELRAFGVKGIEDLNASPYYGVAFINPRVSASDRQMLKDRQVMLTIKTLSALTE